MMGSCQYPFLTANTVCAVGTPFSSATYHRMSSQNNDVPTRTNQHFRYQKGALT